MIWAHYILQVNIYLTLFYCFYRILLEKETYFNFNRTYLLGAGLFSLTIPFLRFEWFIQQEAAQPIYHGVDQINSFVAVATLEPVAEGGVEWGKYVVLIYLAGILFFFLRFLLSLFSLKKLFLSKTQGSAFSFLGRKKVDPSLPNNEVIHQHEDVHIRGMHTLDVLFFEILAIFLWFNPVTGYYKNAIKSIHEFLADEEAANFQGDKTGYALILLSNALQVDPHILTNNFATRSLIKKRIFMLHKQRSRKVAILKYGLIVPLFGLALVFSSATIRKNEKIIEVAEKLPFDEVIAPATLSIIPSPERKITVNLSKLNKENWQAFYTFLALRMKYPTEAEKNGIQGNSQIKFTALDGSIKDVGIVTELGAGCDEEAMKTILAYSNIDKSISGKYTIQISFRLSGTDNPIRNESISTIPGYKNLKPIFVAGVDQGAVSIRSSGVVINRPIKLINGTPIATDNTLVIVNGVALPSSTLSTLNPENIASIKVVNGVNAVAIYGELAKNGALEITTKDEPLKEIEVVGTKDDKIYDYVSIEKAPEYPGGIDKFRQYLSANIKYPAEAAKVGLQGTVYVNFTIEKDGSLTDIRVDRKVGLGLDEEAIRVVQASKRWMPGIQNSRPVRVKYNVPVKFSVKR